MSRFLSSKYSSLAPYTPGEQPKDMVYIKLNTNESPFPPSRRAVNYASKAAKRLALYPDPDCRELAKKLSRLYGVSEENLILTNGSDEVLNFAFMAYCDGENGAVFPDITYGFYSVFAQINCVPYEEKPLTEDFRVNISDYIGCNKTVFIANPNAPTGIALSVDEIEKIVASNPENVVVVDEAYVDFGAESCVPLTKKYKNLLVTGTFSKSRSMAGARLGFGIGDKELIADLMSIKYSTNPYNVNRMTAAAGLGQLADEKTTRKNCKTVMENREYLKDGLQALGFTVIPSKTNFLFAKCDGIDGAQLYRELKARGILVRHFDKDRLCEYNRITVGTKKQMTVLLDTVKTILEEKQ